MTNSVEMFIVKNYLTDEVVAIVSRREDAVAMTKSRRENDPILVFEKK